MKKIVFSYLLFNTLFSITYYRYKILNKIPHKGRSFTQGLIYLNGYLYESTGKRGESSLKKIDLKSGKVLKHVYLKNFFGEGLAYYQNNLIQLTWKRGLAQVYKLSDFSKVKRYTYQGEGWGITVSPKGFVMSDGGSYLTLRRFDDFSPVKKIRVTIEGEPLRRLNELEYARGRIYANVWHETFVAVINLDNGKVEGIVPFENLFKQLPKMSHESVLNGIAYDPKKDNFYITGKNWPFIFEVKITQ